MPEIQHSPAEFQIFPVAYTDPITQDKVFRDEIYLYLPFSKNHIVHRKMEPSDKVRFNPAWLKFTGTPEYRAFMNSDGDDVTYHHIKNLPGMTPAKQKFIEGAGITSIEQLATASEDQLNTIRGGDKLVKQAQEFLADLNRPVVADQVIAKAEAKK